METALRYLGDLEREAADEPALLRELAAAYERIAEIQGMPGWPSEGRSGDALASFERALELARRSDQLATVADVTAEARLLVRIGSVLAARGQPSAALLRHRAGLALTARLVTAEPSTANRLDHARALVAVGDDVWELGDVPAALSRANASGACPVQRRGRLPVSRTCSRTPSE